MIDTVKSISCLISAIFCDIYNAIHYDGSTPKKWQLVYVDPHVISLDAQSGFRKEFGVIPKKHPQTIFGGDWDLMALEVEAQGPGYGLEEVAKRVVDLGLGWQEAGEVERITKSREMRGSKQRPLAYDIRKCKEFDVLTESVITHERLFSRREIDPLNYREKGGIGVLIGRDGKVLKGNDGHHRLAIAKALGLRAVPASIQCVHKEAVDVGIWTEHILSFTGIGNRKGV